MYITSTVNAELKCDEPAAYGQHVAGQSHEVFVLFLVSLIDSVSRCSKKAMLRPVNVFLNFFD